MLRITVASALVSIVFFVSPAFAQVQADLSKAYDAYDNGDYQAAASLFLASAQLGKAEAQLNLGILYLNGLGVDQNNQEAVRWIRMAAERGEAQAQANMGHFILTELE